MRQTWRTSAVFSASGPTMKPGVSHSDRIGMSKASQSCMKRAALSAASASIAPPRCIGLLAMTPNGRALDAHQGRDHADAELAAQLQHGAFVGQRVDHGAHVIDAQAVLRDRRGAEPLVGAAPFADRALEVGQVLLGDAHRLRLVLDQHVDDAVRHLHARRPDFLGRDRRRARRPRSSPDRPCRWSCSWWR